MTSQLEVQEIPTGSCKTLRLADNSNYLASVTVTNALLEITPPGASCPVVFEVEKDFSKTVNSASLNISPTQSYNDLVPLPDGPYEIKYSINPNLKVYVEYTLFRNCRLVDKYAGAICSLFNDRSKISHKEFDRRRKDLIWIKEVIDASKYIAEECGDIDAAMALYNEASILLLKTKTQC